MEDIDSKIKKLFKDLDKSKLKKESTDTDILIQQLLQKIILSYVVDIKAQLELKQNDLASTYPCDLISSLKHLLDLYFKMKHKNSMLTIKENERREGYVF